MAEHGLVHIRLERILAIEVGNAGDSANCKICGKDYRWLPFPPHGNICRECQPMMLAGSCIWMPDERLMVSRLPAVQLVTRVEARSVGGREATILGPAQSVIPHPS